MKALVVLLFAANLGVAGWWYFAPPANHATVVPTIPPSAKRLSLLSEKLSASGESVAVTRESVTQSKTASGCFTLGPFSDQATAVVVREELEALGANATQRVIREREQYAFRVFLPPAADRAAALAKTQELRNKGITDYFVISSEVGMQNAIALGLFKQKRHADRHTKFLNQKGFEAQMQPRYRERRRYWIDYEDTTGSVTAEVLTPFSAENAIGRFSRACV